MGLNLDLFIDDKIIKRSRMYKNVKLKALFFLIFFCTVYNLRRMYHIWYYYKTCINCMYKTHDSCSHE